MICLDDDDDIIDFGSKKIKLRNGVDMPLLGLRTYHVLDADDLHLAVDVALETGYRLFDTCTFFENEQYLGNSIRHLLQKYGLKREDIFITTKLSPADYGYNNAQKALERSLQNLGFDYVDLYLLPFPSAKMSAAAKLSADNPVNKDLRIATWQAMVEMYHEGKAKAIGVSNFTVKYLQQLNGCGGISPMVNQIVWHPHYFQPEIKEYCQYNSISLQAYQPFGGLSMGDHSLIDDNLVKLIALRYAITPAQVLLQWSVQQDVPVVFKSINANHIKINYHLNIEISAAELSLLDNLNKYVWDSNFVFP